MIRYLGLKITRNRSLFPRSTGISKYFVLYTILRKKQIDFNKEFDISYGEYVQAYDNHLPTNNNTPQSIDAIYLMAEPNLHGGHVVMDLATGRTMSGPQVDKVKMTRLVIERVEILARRQGLKSLKFFNRKHEEMSLLDADLVEGVEGVEISNEDRDFNPLSPIDD